MEFAVRHRLGLVIGSAVLVGLYLTSRYSYLLFHSLAELFSVVVAYSIFIIAWNARRYTQNGYFLVVGISYLAVGLLDLLHTLGYAGMSIFQDHAFVANQLWIAARFLESLSLLLGFAYLSARRRPDPALLISSFAVVTGLLLAAIFVWRIFPVCFVAGQGQTRFKIISEFVIMGILAADAGLLVRNRHRFEHSIYLALLGAALTAILTEAAFTVYVSNFGVSNLLGHLLKVLSFFFIYVAIVKHGVERPYEMVFRELAATNGRLRAEVEAHRATEGRFLRTFEESPIGAAILDLDKRYLRVNQALCTFLGYPEEELVGKSYAEITHPDDLANDLCHVKKVIAGELDRYEVEKRYVRRDGSIVWGHLNLKMLQDGPKGMRYMLPLIVDITARRQAEETAQEKSGMIQLLLESTSEAVVGVDPKGSCTFCNQAFLRLFGYDRPEQLLGRNLDTVIHHPPLADASAPDPDCPVHRACLAGSETHLEDEVLWKADGSSFPAEYWSHPLHRNGALVGAVVTCVDITERKHAKALLEAKVHQRTAALDHANRLLRVISACNETLVRATSEAELVHEICRLAVEVGGYKKACLRYAEDDEQPPRETRGSSASLEQGPGCGPAGRCIHTGQLCHGGDECAETDLRTWRRPAADQGARSSLAFPLVIAGKVGAFLEIFSLEVDELKEVETDMLSKLANDLAFGIEAIRSRQERIRVRLQLEHRTGMLRTLTTELVQSEHRERHRLAKVLHDHLQQLLVAAKWRAGALAGGAQDDGTLAACGQLVELLDQAIQSSRDLAGELSPAGLHDKGLIPALEWLANQLRERHGFGVEILRRQDQFPLAIEFKEFLFDAIRELLFNVIKHAGVQQARVRLAQTDTQFEVIVEDDGAGFDVDQALENRTGTGLGLFSIRERLEYLGGWMLLKSTPGQGSQFHLVLPVARGQAGPPEAGRERTEAGPAPLPAPEPMGLPRRLRVLMVDDHRVVRQGLARLLGDQAGLDIVGEADDGLEAVELALRLRPDVVLMDINMPGLNGIKATRLIHAAQPDIRIIGLSLHKDADLGDDMKKAGAVAYVCKSDPLEIILAAIQDGQPRRQR